MLEDDSGIRHLSREARKRGPGTPRGEHMEIAQTSSVLGRENTYMGYVYTHYICKLVCIYIHIYIYYMYIYIYISICFRASGPVRRHCTPACPCKLPCVKPRISFSFFVSFHVHFFCLCPVISYHFRAMAPSFPSSFSFISLSFSPHFPCISPSCPVISLLHLHLSPFVSPSLSFMSLRFIPPSFRVPFPFASLSASLRFPGISPHFTVVSPPSCPLYFPCISLSFPWHFSLASLPCRGSRARYPTCDAVHAHQPSSHSSSCGHISGIISPEFHHQSPFITSLHFSAFLHMPPAFIHHVRLISLRFPFIAASFPLHSLFTFLLPSHFNVSQQGCQTKRCFAA